MPRSRSKSKPLFRAVIFWSHLGVGLVAGLVLLSTAVTGLVIAFEPQLVAFAERRARQVTVPDGAVRLPVTALIDGARKASAAKPSGMMLRADPAAAAIVRFGREGGTFYVNPYTAEVTGGESALHEGLHKVEEWHRWLWNKKFGRPLTGAACALFLALLISGLYLWWPRSWHPKALRGILQFNPKLQGKARDWNWHNVIGFWGAPLFLISTLTGLVMAYRWANDALYRLAGSPPPVQNAAPRERGKEEPFFPGNVEALWARAEAQMPGWQLIDLRLPTRPEAPATFSIQGPGARLFQRSQLTLETATGEVKKWEPYTELSRGRRWRIWARHLHTGQAVGLIGQVLAAISVVGTILMIWTGGALAWRRFFNT